MLKCDQSKAKTHGWRQKRGLTAGLVAVVCPAILTYEVEDAHRHRLGAPTRSGVRTMHGDGSHPGILTCHSSLVHLRGPTARGEGLAVNTTQIGVARPMRTSSSTSSSTTSANHKLQGIGQERTARRTSGSMMELGLTGSTDECGLVSRGGRGMVSDMAGGETFTTLRRRRWRVRRSKRGRGERAPGLLGTGADTPSRSGTAADRPSRHSPHQRHFSLLVLFVLVRLCTVS